MAGTGNIGGGPLRLAAIALFILLWSGAFVAVRAGLPDVSPLYFLAVRFTIAGSILACLVLMLPAARGGLAAMRQSWPHFALAGILINGAYLGAAYVAMTEVGAAPMALIGSLQPILTAMLAGPLLGDRFSPTQWLGFLLGASGVALVVGLEAATIGFGKGLAVGLCAVAFIVAGTLYYARFCRGAHLVLANGVQLISAAAFVWVLVVLFEDVHADWTPTALITLAYLVFGVSLGGMGLFLYLIKTGSAGATSANFYLTPGTTALLGWAILGEVLAPLAVAGFVVAALGVWLVQRTARVSR